MCVHVRLYAHVSVYACVCVYACVYVSVWLCAVCPYVQGVCAAAFIWGGGGDFYEAFPFPFAAAGTVPSSVWGSPRAHRARVDFVSVPGFRGSRWWDAA